jgi:CheY-like chemotaxis protein
MRANGRLAQELLRQQGLDAELAPPLLAIAERQCAMHDRRSDATTIPVVSWVLVVDDDPAVRQILGVTLREEGYGVCEAADGVEALAALRSSACPLVTVLDYRLPGLTGGEVVSAVAADPHVAGRHAFVLVSTTPEMLPEWLVLWADRQGMRIVPKPFDLDGLLAAVAEAAGRLRGGAPSRHHGPVPA